MPADYRHYPRTTEDLSSSGEAFRNLITPEFRPRKPVLSRSDYIITQGSCFAQNVADTLGTEGIKTNWLEVAEGMNSPLANRTYLEYMLGLKALTNQNHKLALDVDALGRLKGEIEVAAAFVFTAGLAYVKTGPGGEYYLVSVDGEPFTWRLTDVNENRTHIEAIIAMVRAINPSIKIVISVSPIPLKAAPHGGSAFAADCRSKSILRTAIGEVMDQKIPHVYYWPSFEAVRWLGCHMGPVYGVEAADHRHVGKSFLKEIMAAFVEYYFEPREGG